MPRGTSKLSREKPSAVATTRRKRRSAEEIADRIIEAASEEFALNGYAGATTAAIARRADVTEAQLFRYFGTKSGLFRDAIFKPLNEHFADFQSRYASAGAEGTTTRELAELYITELQDFIGKNARMLMSVIVANAYSPDTTEGLGAIDGLRAYFEQGASTMRQRIEGPVKVAPELMVRVSFAAVLASVMFKDWIFPKGLATDAEIRSSIVDFVIDGINANARHI